MGLSPMSNYRKKIVSCFDIGEVPKSPVELEPAYFFAIHFQFRTMCNGGIGRECKKTSKQVGGRLDLHPVLLFVNESLRKICLVDVGFMTSQAQCT